jgi:mRNA interferase MazF
MNVKRGDIYWITANPYRSTIGSVQKPARPAIIVSNDANNACAYTLEVVYLTSKPKKPLPTHCTITSAEKTSIALCEQVQTVSNEQIGDYVGHCTDEEMEQIDRCIAISLGLPEPNLDSDEEPIFYTDEERTDYLATIRMLERDLEVTTAKLELLRELYDRLLQSSTG